jgi:hypothetical protein
VSSGTSTPPTPPISISVGVHLHDATDSARQEFRVAVQAYAELLVQESQRQELSNRPPGISHPELTANSVVRAKQVLSHYGDRAKRSPLDLSCLAGAPVSFSAAGVFGSYLPAQIIPFGLSAAVALFCVGLLGWRRLL